MLVEVIEEVIGTERSVLDVEGDEFKRELEVEMVVEREVQEEEGVVGEWGGEVCAEEEGIELEGLVAELVQLLCSDSNWLIFEMRESILIL